MEFELRAYVGADADAVNRIALAAFLQYRDAYEDWDRFSQLISRMDALSETAEIVVATVRGQVVGAVAYVAPGRSQASFFESQWAVIRMLVVEPSFRGRGLGRALTEQCFRRAQRDDAVFIALHTSPVMEVALAMYLRMGFERHRSVPPIHGVPYGVYIKRLAS